MKPSAQRKFLPCLLAPVVLINALAAMPAFAGIAPELTLHPDSAQTYCQQPITLDVLDNDSGLNLSIKSVDQPAWVSPGPGSTAIVDNKIVYSPGNNFTGNAKFWYVAKDSLGRSNFTEVNVTVSGTDFTSPFPKAGNDRVDTVTGKPIHINPFWNDTGCQLKIKSITADYFNRGTMKIDNNELVYTPDATRSGEDVFWYVIEDILGRSNYAEVRVVVTDSKIDPGPYPTGIPDVFTVNKNSTMDDNLFDVLANDIGADLVFIEVPATGSHGTVTQEGQVLKYQPNIDYTGSDKFYYAFKDSFGRSNYSKVTINVEDEFALPNNAPVAGDDFLSLNLDAGETEIEVNKILFNDVDADGDALTLTSVGPLSTTVGEAGSVRLVNGRVLYTPSSNLDYATNFFDYTISDGRGGTDTGSIKIETSQSYTRLDFLITANPDIATVSPGDSTLIEVLANDSDADGDALFLNGNGGNTSQGTYQVVADSNGNANTAIRYTASPGASGTDEILYDVTDGRGGNANGTVTITIR